MSTERESARLLLAHRLDDGLRRHPVIGCDRFGWFPSVDATGDRRPRDSVPGEYRTAERDRWVDHNQHRRGGDFTGDERVQADREQVSLPVYNPPR